MILPALNEPDLAELAEEVRRDMTFVPVETGAGHQDRTSDNQPGTTERTDSAGSAPLAARVRPATLAQAIVFYISGHGFGHASRTIEVINAILAQRPETRVGVRTSAPRWLFDLTVKGKVTYSTSNATPASCRSMR